jgi:hypothetical protein
MSLHFSEIATISYAFYKFQQIRYTIEDTVLHWGLWKEMGARNVALGRRGGVAPANAGEPAALSVGEVAGFDYVLT